MNSAMETNLRPIQPALLSQHWFEAGMQFLGDDGVSSAVYMILPLQQEAYCSNKLINMILDITFIVCLACIVIV